MPILKGINNKFKEIKTHRRVRGNIQKMKTILEKEGKSKPQGSDTNDLVHVVDKEGNYLRDTLIFQSKKLNQEIRKTNGNPSVTKKKETMRYKPFKSSREFCKCK